MRSLALKMLLWAPASVSHCGGRPERTQGDLAFRPGRVSIPNNVCDLDRNVCQPSLWTLVSLFKTQSRPQALAAEASSAPRQAPQVKVVFTDSIRSIFGDVDKENFDQWRRNEEVSWQLSIDFSVDRHRAWGSGCNVRW